MSLMKNHSTKQFVVALALLAIAAISLRSQPDSQVREPGGMPASTNASLPDDLQTQVRQPALDSEGRFWVYRNGKTHPKMPFTPYGWASDATNLTQIIHVDLECQEHPCTLIKTSPPESPRCICMWMTWDDATWASVAFISGPEKLPWWGESKAGWYYDLGALPKRKLVFYARGDKGGEVIKAQIGALSDKAFGDSLAKPIVSEDLELTPEWTRFEIDLTNTPAAQLGKICNGFGVVVERAAQPGSPAETRFYLDDVYYE